MKKLISNYTFNPLSRTVTFDDYAAIDLEGLLLITNVTDNIIIYNFADASVGGGVNNNVVTLSYDTTSMDSADALQIYYDDVNESPALQATLQSLEDMVDYMKILVSNTKTLQTQDVNQRLRVILDNSSTTNVQGTVNTQSVFGEISQRQELSRIQFANGIRSNLVF